MITQVLVGREGWLGAIGKETFEFKDPIYVRVKWKNYKIPKGTELYCMVFFVVYYQNEWLLVPFNYKGEKYYWGEIASILAPDPNTEYVDNFYSYVLGFKVTLDAGCYVLLVKNTRKIKTCTVNWGHGYRCIGLRATDVKALINETEVYADKLFENMFTIQPPTAPAEFISCEVYKQ